MSQVQHVCAIVKEEIGHRCHWITDCYSAALTCSEKIPLLSAETLHSFSRMLPFLVTVKLYLNMNDTLKKDHVRRQGRETYSAIAQNKNRGCGCGSNCDDSVLKNGTDPAKLDYAKSDVASVPEGSEMGLGCGNPTALASIKPGETVLDLGSGGGFDCFLAAKLTGSTGRVIGVDMTPEMISKARANTVRSDYTNVEFRLGEIESLPVADHTVDLIISNCVINLSPDKPRVYAEAFRVLKGGGRIAISDLIALRPLPKDLKADIVAYVGCVGGASSLPEVKAMLVASGFEKIQVTIKEASREFINEWLPSRGVGDYIASADITAVKPGAARFGSLCCT